LARSSYRVGSRTPNNTLQETTQVRRSTCAVHSNRSTAKVAYFMGMRFFDQNRPERWENHSLARSSYRVGSRTSKQYMQENNSVRRSTCAVHSTGHSKVAYFMVCGFLIKIDLSGGRPHLARSCTCRSRTPNNTLQETTQVRRSTCAVHSKQVTAKVAYLWYAVF